MSSAIETDSAVARLAGKYLTVVVVQIKAVPRQSRAHRLIVDSVEEVLKFTASEIDATPDFGVKIETA